MRKTQMGLHLGPEWYIFHILTGEDIEISFPTVVISRLKWKASTCLGNKKKLIDTAA